MIEQPTPETEQILTELALGNIGLAAANEKIGRIERERDEARDQRDELTEAMEKLHEKCDDSDDAKYGTLSTRFVRDIVSEALASMKGVSDE
jgi:hypothetical protein